MPVEDHEVHEKVRIQSDTPYGCHSRKKMSDGYWAKDRRYLEDGYFEEVYSFIPHAMSTACRNFYIWDTDPRCKGCTAEKDIDYALRMQSL